MNSDVLIVPASDVVHTSTDLPKRWTREKAGEWYAHRPWPVGCNYIPSTASNQLEMWQADTFDPQRIDVELGWAAGLGFNAVRVFLHDLVWLHDAAGYFSRIDQFLCIASRHGIDTLFVIFDSCWDPAPHAGPQEGPRQGVHNSRWVQSPGGAELFNLDSYPRLRQYVTELVGSFAEEPRIMDWDVWNEPDNDNVGSYPSAETANKLALVGDLLSQVFDWARLARPSQPLTSGIWFGDWSSPEGLTAIQRTQVEQSDVISFHNYENVAEFAKRVGWLQAFGRPLLCTEYMARSLGSTFEEILPVAKANKVAAFNWGFVSGKTQTCLPWTSWQSHSSDDREAKWFHEILRENGSPYSQSEVETIRRLVKENSPVVPEPVISE
jgi:hypothetical protein